MWNRLRPVRYGWLLCVFGLVLSSAPAFATGDTVSFVAGVQPSDARPAAWVEGVWFGVLRDRLRSTETILGGIPAAKKTALEKAKKFFTAGKKAFDDLSPDSAFRNFRNAVRQFEESIPYIRDVELLAKSWAYIGVSYLLNGKNAEGKAAFRRALLLRPGFDLKTSGVTKDQAKITLFNEVRSAIKSAGTALLSVSAKPAGAVYLNGRFVGIAPIKRQVPKGTHIVMVRRPGWRWWGKQVAISGAGFSLSAALKVRPAAAVRPWKKGGLAAVVHTLKRSDMPTEVATFATLTKGTKLLLARVRLTKGGKQLAIQAAVYEPGTQKQLAAGGALVPWGPSAASRATVAQLLRSLLNGQPAALGGWTPSSLGLGAPSSGKGGAGLAIGLGVGLGLLAAGGVAILVVYLVKPEAFGGTPNCGTNGACVTLVVK